MLLVVLFVRGSFVLGFFSMLVGGRLRRFLAATEFLVRRDFVLTGVIRVLVAGAAKTRAADAAEQACNKYL